MKKKQKEEPQYVEEDETSEIDMLPYRTFGMVERISDRLYKVEYQTKKSIRHLEKMLTVLLYGQIVSIVLVALLFILQLKQHV